MIRMRRYVFITRNDIRKNELVFEFTGKAVPCWGNIGVRMLDGNLCPVAIVFFELGEIHVENTGRENLQFVCTGTPLNDGYEKVVEKHARLGKKIADVRKTNDLKASQFLMNIEILRFR